MSTSTLKVHTVTCDRCGRTWSSQGGTILNFRRGLKTLGWRVAKFDGRHYNLDVCPSCQS